MKKNVVLLEYFDRNTEDNSAFEHKKHPMANCHRMFSIFNCLAYFSPFQPALQVSRSTSCTSSRCRMDMGR